MQNELPDTTDPEHPRQCAIFNSYTVLWVNDLNGVDILGDRRVGNWEKWWKKRIFIQKTSGLPPLLKTSSQQYKK